MPSTNQGKAARVRELSRRLKPIIGQKAERIWKAYMAETDDGKQQLLDYLELLAARHLEGNLDDEAPGLVPPSKDEATGEYDIGEVVYGNRTLHRFGLREDEWIQHVGVFGRSGAGKTNLGYLLMQRLVQQGKPVLMFDWKRNYRDLLAKPGFENAAVYTIGRSAAPLSFNPLIPPPDTNPKTWLKKLIAVIAHAYLLGNGVLHVLQQAIDQVYEAFGVYQGSVDRWPTFRDVQAVLKQRETSGREAGWLTSALRAMASLTFGDMDSLVNRDSNNLKALLERPVILELDALTQTDKVFFIQSLLLWIHHFRMTEGRREQFKHAILIEEAHHVLSGERTSLTGGQSVMELTFREIREFGESLIILDQHPSQISMPSLGNTYATFCFNLKHRSDISAISQAMLLEDDEKQILGSLPVGQAVARLQGRGRGPFTIAVPEVDVKKGAVTDQDVQHHMTQLGLLSERHQKPQIGSQTTSRAAYSEKHPTQPRTTPDPEPSPSQNPPEENIEMAGHAEARSPESGTAALDETDLAMLRDIAQYPDSGIAARYKRLGLSVRQGQKRKNALLTHGLLVEHSQTTRTGKHRTLRLTEKGRIICNGSDSGEHGNAAAEPDTAWRPSSSG